VARAVLTALTAATVVYHIKHAHTVQSVWSLHSQVLKELHVVDWSDCDTEKVPYRRIEDYVASMTKPKADQHGLVHDLEFDKKFDEVGSAAKCKM